MFLNKLKGDKMKAYHSLALEKIVAGSMQSCPGGWEKYDEKTFFKRIVHWKCSRLSSSKYQNLTLPLLQRHVYVGGSPLALGTIALQ